MHPGHRYDEALLATSPFRPCGRGGSLFGERGLPGVGSLIVSAVLRRDDPVIQGALLVIAGLYLLINFVIDMPCLPVDPRVRY